MKGQERVGKRRKKWWQGVKGRKEKEEGIRRMKVGKDCEGGGREQEEEKEEAVKARIGCIAERNLKKWEE
jgi:hypothetical protein